MAARYGIGRQEQDDFALASYQKALAAVQGGMIELEGVGPREGVGARAGSN